MLYLVNKSGRFFSYEYGSIVYLIQAVNYLDKNLIPSFVQDTAHGHISLSKIVFELIHNNEIFNLIIFNLL